VTQLAAVRPRLTALARAGIACAVMMAGVLMAGSSQAQTSQPISHWVSCDPQADQRDNAAKAFAAAANNAFTLVVDCPVFIHVGQDVERPIFLDNGVHVAMTGAGRFIVDNVFIPTFVIANSNDIEMRDWDVEYIGSMPTNPKTGGYTKNGAFVAYAASDPAAFYFNDEVLTGWLAAHRGIVFPHTTTPWSGPTNAAATFRFLGSSSRISIVGMRFHAAPGADVDHLIPVAFNVDGGYRNGVTAPARGAPVDPGLIAIPSQMTVEGLTLDGAYMGWVGSVQDSTFDHITSLRYGDLQTPRGGDLGGVGKWFAPPHLFYFVAVGTLPTNNIKITNVVDRGQRLGLARDTVPGQLSGYALSLKIGANNSVVSNYVSYRPDGLLDVLQASNMTLTNIHGEYNSAFLNNLFSGIRFPGTNMHNVTLSDVSIRDVAPVSLAPPISNMPDQHSDHVVLRNVTVSVNSAAQGLKLIPTVVGAGSSAEVRQTPAH